MAGLREVFERIEAWSIDNNRLESESGRTRLAALGRLDGFDGLGYFSVFTKWFNEVFYSI